MSCFKQISNHERRPSQIQILNKKPLYPTEEVLFCKFPMLKTKKNCLKIMRMVNSSKDKRKNILQCINLPVAPESIVFNLKSIFSMSIRSHGF